MPLKKREFVQLLQSKFGFAEDENRSDDHRWFVLQLDDLPAIATKVSRSGSEITTALAAMIARQLRVRKTFFVGMFDCTNDRAAYVAQVTEDPFPPWEVRF